MQSTDNKKQCQDKGSKSITKVEQQFDLFETTHFHYEMTVNRQTFVAPFLYYAESHEISVLFAEN